MLVQISLSDPAFNSLGCTQSSQSIQLCNMKNRDIYWRRYKIQEALYTRQWCLSPLQSRYLGTSHSSPNLHQLPQCIFLNLIDGLKSLPFQRWVLGKASSQTAPNLGCRRAESPGWFDVLPKNSTRDVMHEQAIYCEEAANHWLPIAVAFWIAFLEECPSLMQNLMQIHCSIHSVILNATATQYTCSLNGIYCPHGLEQWGRHWSCMGIPAHSSWLPGYINEHANRSLMLTMAELFLDRSCIPKSGIAGSCGNFLFHFLRNYHTVFYSYCTILTNSMSIWLLNIMIYVN